MSTSTATKAKGAPASLSISQMVQLMRLETDRGTQHSYPVSTLMIALEGFDRAEERELRRRLLPALFGELKRVTFEGSMKGLGLTQDQFILALFPHTPPELAREVGEKLLGRAHSLEIAGLPKDREVRLSIGIGHNQHPGTVSFESLVEEAEVGVHLARRGGSDRVAVWRHVETEIDRLRGELEREIRAIAQQSQTFSEKRIDEGVKWGRGLVEKAIDLFDHVQVPSAALVRMKREVVALITSEVDHLIESAVFQELEEKTKQIDLLERRITKLTQHLDLTETELKRIAQMKSIDLGVASIYSAIQGLASDESNAEQKREMLKTIFEANVSFREAIATKEGPTQENHVGPVSPGEDRPLPTQVAQQ